MELLDEKRDTPAVLPPGLLNPIVDALRPRAVLKLMLRWLRW